MIHFFNSKIASIAKTLFLSYSFYFIYLFVFILVSYGIIYSTGSKFLNELLIYFVSFTLSYFILSKKIRFDFVGRIIEKYYVFNSRNERLLNISVYILAFFVVLFVVFHFWFLGHIPALSSYLSLDYYGIALIRQSIIEHNSTFIKYMCAFVLKGFLPFLLIYFLFKSKPVFILLTLVAVLYSLALMQKAYIVTVLAPLTIYAFLNRKYILTAVLSIIPFIGVYLLVYITNPQLRATEEEIALYLSDKDSTYLNKMYKDMSASGIKKNKSAVENLKTATEGVSERVFVTTGKASSYWLELIPDTFAYAYGCGYKFLAPLLGCDYKEYDYSRKVYDIVYENNAKKGLEGTVTVASFIYDYANFGKIGLILSGILLSVLFLFIQFLFKENVKHLIALNFLNIWWLSSAYYTTLLLSGGWALLILLYILFKPQLNKK
ncbi:MAG: hypothetical protein D8M18_06410 [Bacteroidetes bacterium]|nr:hypothetical protein [Bacteroidota bacterium]GIK69679.1 MAG: hypothetical protein BroJett020_09740 [Bacteroidota bacterium]